MILSGSKVLASNMVSELHGEGQLQPCGIDMTLKEVHALLDNGEADFDNSNRRLSKSELLGFTDGKIHLAQGCYKIIYNEYVSIPVDCCAFGFPRSTLLRCGADVRCAVWDPGYHGRSESLLVVHNAHGITLHKNAKVMQLVFARLEEKPHAEYSGQYKGENGEKK